MLAEPSGGGGRGGRDTAPLPRDTEAAERARCGSQLWDHACTRLRGPARAPLYLETLAVLPCCAFYEARGGEVLTRTAGTFFGGAVTHLTYRWPTGEPHQRRH
jgi:hypothetical protein